MGKKSRQKKSKQIQTNLTARSPMDPALMEAFTRGRNSGYKNGKVEGLAEMMQLFDKWVDEIETHVKGIGPKTKMEIQYYFAERIKTSVEEKQILNGEIEILNNNVRKE